MYHNPAIDERGLFNYSYTIINAAHDLSFPCLLWLTILAATTIVLAI